MKTQLQGTAKTESEAMRIANQIIGGAIVQRQGDEWLVFNIEDEPTQSPEIDFSEFNECGPHAC